LEAASGLEEYAPFLLAPVLGSLGMVYLEISPHFHEKTLELHHHALRLLETPLGFMTGAISWADLCLCAVMTGDFELAQVTLDKALNVPNTYSMIERPRHLVGAARLAGAQGDWERALKQANDARAYAEERQLRQHYPLTALTQGKVQLEMGEHEAALEALSTAKKEAVQMGMRTILWQAHAAAGAALEGLDRTRQAEEERLTADKILSDIADQFEDSDLKTMFLNAHQPQIFPRD
jgi:tetratricopeptide (TPR) repeat protein